MQLSRKKYFSSDILYKNIWQISMFDSEFLKQVINLRQLTLDSIDPSWESNPGHLFRYHTARPPRIL